MRRTFAAVRKHGTTNTRKDKSIPDAQGFAYLNGSSSSFGYRRGAGMRRPDAGQANAAESPHGPRSRAANAEMIAHQAEMQGLLARLDKSFKAVADARDTKGYLPDKSILKAHEADISSLRTAVRDHKLFADLRKEQCGDDSKQHDRMVQHQEQMKGILYDVVDTWEEHLKADASGAQVSDSVGLTLSEHQGALQRLNTTISQYQTAMAHMGGGCS